MVRNWGQEEKMNVMVLTDLEGISGVETIDAVIPSGTDKYFDSCEKLVDDTNAAVSALFDAGAKKVYVLDGHGAGTNFPAGRLDKRATQINIQGMTEAIKDVCCVVLVGMHAMAGTRTAFLDHTQNSSKIHRYYYNGKRIGELSQIGFFAGYYGVPIVAATGDDAACREAEAFVPGIATAEVKRAVKRNLADCLPLTEARERIYKATRQGFEKRGEISPMEAKLPLCVEIEFNRADYADDALENNPSLERVDEFFVRSVKEKVEGYLDVLILY
jgi:D-amino peptidase